MKKKATARPAKAASRQSTLNFPPSSEADLVAESTAAVMSTKSGAKNRRKRTADFADDADKHNKAHCDSSAISAQSAVKNVLTDPSQETVILPDGWRWMKAHEVGEINLGRQRSPKHLSADFPTKYLRAANITEKGLDLSDVLEMDFKPAEKERYQLRAGDILISEASGSAAQVGKPAIWNDELPVCCFQNTVIRLRPNAVSSKYLLWLFTHFYRNGVFARVAGGVGINHLSASKFSELSLPIAPRAEQHRIVAEIEKQFTRLDVGVAALKRVQANLKRYRAAVLKAACEGKLVPTEAELANRGGTNFQSGAELLATISDLEANDLNPRRAGRLWGAGHVPDLTDEERLSLPDGWVWAKVRELGFDPENAVQVGPMSMKSSDFTDAGTPVLNVGCVQWGRFVESKLDHLPADKAAEFERYRIKCGDVLFTRSGTVGRCAVAQPHQDGWLMTFHLLRARANPQKCLPHFLRIVFEGAPHIRRQTREASVGSTRAGFNTNLLGNLAVPLPPLAEQTRIVAEVERRLSVLDEVESVVSTNLRLANRLRQSVLQKAFEGKLGCQ